MRAQARVRNGYAVIRLTHKQWVAMRHALGNSTDHPDAMDSLFQDGRNRRACHEADEVLGKVCAAIHNGKRGVFHGKGMHFEAEGGAS